MKKPLGLIFLFLLLPGFTYSQDLSPIGDDFSVFFTEFGNEIAPNLRLTSIAGGGIADAEIGEFPAFFFSFSAGASLSGGIGDLISNISDRTELLDPASLLDSAGISEGNKTYDTITSFFPYPFYRASLGFGITGGYEVMLQFSILPQALSNSLAGLAGISDVVLNSMNAGGHIRKVLMTEGKLSPAASVGLGYIYSGLNIGYPLSSVGSISISDGDLTISGDMSVKARVNSVGIDFTLSKKLLFFRPYLSVSPYLQNIFFRGAIDDFDAVLESGGTEIASYSGSGGGDPVGQFKNWDLLLLVSSGFEFVIGKFVLFTHGYWNPSEMLVGAEIGMRFQN
jgi:hypothetical protein